MDFLTKCWWRFLYFHLVLGMVVTGRTFVYAYSNAHISLNHIQVASRSASLSCLKGWRARSRPRSTASHVAYSYPRNRRIHLSASSSNSSSSVTCRESLIETTDDVMIPIDPDTTIMGMGSSVMTMMEPNETITLASSLSSSSFSSSSSEREREKDKDEDEDRGALGAGAGMEAGAGGKVDMFLFSFPNLYEKENENEKDMNMNMNPTSKTSTSKLLKRWKYYCLGDGGVYFDQRPNTLKALNHLLSKRVAEHIHAHAHANANAHGNVVSSSQSQSQQAAPTARVVVETAVLSTCARFEILVTVMMMMDADDRRRLGGTHHNECHSDGSDVNANANVPIDVHVHDVVQDAVTQVLAEQMAFQTMNRRRRMLFSLKTRLPLSILDQPRRIRNDAREVLRSKYSKDPKEMRMMIMRGKSNDLKEEMTSYVGVKDVSHRLCLMAAGLLQDATRPIFRPFSARDAHIMAQIKRTSNGAVRYESTSTSHSSDDDDDDDVAEEEEDKDTTTTTTTYCKLLFDAALQAGKAARSPKVVPLLEELRHASNGADGPPALSRQAAASAKALAVNPTVHACVHRLRAMEASGQIQQLRERAMTLIEEKCGGGGGGGDLSLSLSLDDPACVSIRRMLHQPTMDLREGKYVDTDRVLNEIEHVLLNEILRPD